MALPQGRGGEERGGEGKAPSWGKKARGGGSREGELNWEEQRALAWSRSAIWASGSGRREPRVGDGSKQRRLSVNLEEKYLQFKQSEKNLLADVSIKQQIHLV